ncbi:unnamed protein product [Microthlaspi erraticum]|uniref:Uncharacterized protein n=1 Tax=Microthlaspi erraticum TaxID=1685480 RepID=A0A6D2J6V6_9BRAS|nr:unnamed protein product [Microthlaspi erraticum]
MIATLHHQIVYKVQDHALDLALPSSDDALYLEVTSATQAPNTIQIPRQISRDELVRRLPKSWDGRVLYPFKDENGHQYLDLCSCSACEEDYWNYESDDEIRRRRRAKKDPLYKRYLDGDPTVGPFGDGKYDFIVQYSEKKEPEIMMMQAKTFPPNEDFTKEDVNHSPKILTRAINSTGPNQLSQGEKVLNWQTKNALAKTNCCQQSTIRLINSPQATTKDSIACKALSSRSMVDLTIFIEK